MNQDNILMRDLCDTLMQNHMSQDVFVEKAIVDFRASLRPEQRKQFNAILDAVNTADSEYFYDAFTTGVIFGTNFIV